MADRGSFFEIGPLWGTDQVVGFARFDGHPVGVIASDSRHVNGGAITADGCDKLTRHLDLCDLFHLPVLNLVDNPGFAVGLEHEIAGTIRQGGDVDGGVRPGRGADLHRDHAAQLRRRRQQPGDAAARPSMRVAWPAADVGGIPPEGGIEAAYKRQLAEAADPVALRAELNARIESARGPIGPLNRFQIEELIDPRDTRRLRLRVGRRRLPGRHPALPPGARALGFRPRVSFRSIFMLFRAASGTLAARKSMSKKCRLKFGRWVV